MGFFRLAAPDATGWWDTWGSAADLATAGLAFGALAVAVFAGVAGWRANRAQQETLELQQRQFQHVLDQSEREQARKVNYDIGRVGLRGVSPDEPVVFGDGRTLVATGGSKAEVLNASDSPVYLIYIYDQKHLLCSADRLFPTGSTPVKFKLRHSGGWPFSVTNFMYFQDSNGVAWIRERAGGLRKATDEDREQIIALRDGVSPPAGPGPEAEGPSRAGAPPEAAP